MELGFYTVSVHIIVFQKNISNLSVLIWLNQILLFFSVSIKQDNDLIYLLTLKIPNVLY